MENPSKNPFKLITQQESWKKEVDNSLTTMAEEILKEVKEGQYTGMAFCAVLKDGSTVIQWSKRSDAPALQGAAFKLAVRLVQE